MTQTGSVNSELRGWVARRMIAEDARWAMDVIFSAQRETGLTPFIPLILGHHFVRIAYEGSQALRSSNPHVGVPKLARLLAGQYASVTAQARHVTKLLDDTSKTYETVITELEAIAQEHRGHFTGNATVGPEGLRLTSASTSQMGGCSVRPGSRHTA